MIFCVESLQINDCVLCVFLAIRAATAHGRVTSYYTKEGSDVCLWVCLLHPNFENLKSRNFSRFFRAPKKVDFFEILSGGKKKSTLSRLC